MEQNSQCPYTEEVYKRKRLNTFWEAENNDKRSWAEFLIKCIIFFMLAQTYDFFMGNQRVLFIRK